MGDSEVGGVASKFGVSGANENGRKLRCVRKRLSAGNTFFEKRSTSLHGQVDWMTVKLYWTPLWCRMRKSMLLDVNVLRGAGGGISDHHLVIAKIRFLRWTRRIVNMER